MINYIPQKLAPVVLVLGALLFIGIGIISLILDPNLSTGLAYLYDGILFLLGSFLIFLAIRSARNRYP